MAPHLTLPPLLLCPAPAVDCFTSLRITYPPNLTRDSSREFGQDEEFAGIPWDCMLECLMPGRDLDRRETFNLQESSASRLHSQELL